MATVSTTCKGTYGSHYTLYLQYTLNSQSIANNTSNITVKMYAKADSTSYQAHNLNETNPVTIKVGGSTKVSKNIAMDFRNKKTVDMGSWTGNVTHGTDGKLTTTLSGSFTINGVSSLSGGSISKSWTLTTIPRASTVTCADGNIGSSTTITIARASNSFTHTLTYEFPKDAQNAVTGTIATKTSSTSLGWTIPTSFYAKIPNAKSGQGKITCQTYNGSTLIGSKTCNFNASVINSNPTVSATITLDSDTNLKTGATDKVIKYYTDATVDITATGQNSATISSVGVTCGNKTGSTATSNLTDLESATFVVSAKDSRQNSNSVTYDSFSLIEYVKVAITDISLERLNTTSDTVKINVQGNYWGHSFGSASNTLTLKFRAKEAGGSYGSYTTLSPTTDTTNNTFSFSGNLSGTYNFQKQYTFEVVATDVLFTNVEEQKREVVVPRGIPVIDIGKDDVVVNVETTYSEDGLYSPSQYGVCFNQYGNIKLKEENESNNCNWNISDEAGNTGLKYFFHNRHLQLIDANNNAIIGANGGEIYLRPSGPESTTGQVRINTNGNVGRKVSNGEEFWVPQIAKGSVSITPSASNTPTGKSVSFGKTFTSAPSIFTSLNSAVPGTTALGSGWSGVSTTSVTIYVSRTNTTATSVYWLAVN